MIYGAQGTNSDFAVTDYIPQLPWVRGGAFATPHFLSGPGLLTATFYWAIACTRDFRGCGYLLSKYARFLVLKMRYYVVGISQGFLIMGYQGYFELIVCVRLRVKLPNGALE